VLDGVVVETDAQIPEQAVRFLLAKGVKFAVRTREPPDANYPWKQDGPWWRLEYEPLGPKGWIGESAYAPVRNWRPGALPRTRINVVILGVLFAIFALGSSLLRGRMRIAAMTLVSIGAIGAFGVFALRQPLQREASGGIVILNESLQQNDSWNYYTSVSEAFGLASFNGMTRPMPMSLEHLRSFDPRLVCAGDGRPFLFLVNAARGRTICFFNSGVNPRTGELMPLPTTSSPLRTLVGEFYASPAARVVGEGSGGEGSIPYVEEWPTVIIDRRKNE
jgi:hypothetical protein